MSLSWSGASGHIGRHWPQNSDRACLQGASLTLAEAERGGRARDCCPGWVCHHPILDDDADRSSAKPTRQARCSTRVRRGAKPRGEHLYRSLTRVRRGAKPSTSHILATAIGIGASQWRENPGTCRRVFRATPRSELSRHGQSIHMHDPDALSPRMVPSANAHAPTPPAQLGRSPDGWRCSRSTTPSSQRNATPRRFQTAASAMTKSMRGASPPRPPALSPPKLKHRHAPKPRFGQANN